MKNNSYPDQYEYDNKTLRKVTSAITKHYSNHKVKLTWYKQNDSVNYKDKIDATLNITLVDINEDINLQIKKASYPDSFSVSGTAMRDYLTDRHELDGLLVYLVFSDNERLYLFDWEQFITYAQEVSNLWYVKRHDYYIVPVSELIEILGERYCEEIII